MKKTILIIVILLDSLLLIACGKNELGTINELSFEIPKTFSNCEKNESQYSCTYKNNTNLVIIVTIQTTISHHENIISFPLNNFTIESIIIFIDTIIIEIAINIENMYSAFPCPKL